MQEAPWILDRIEDGRSAVLLREDGEERIEPVEALPDGVREGDLLAEVNAGDGDRKADSRSSRPPSGLRYRIDEEATDERRSELARRRAALRRGPSGPISL
jgi:hypothetical protein